MATTVWLALTLWLVMMVGELGVVTQSVSRPCIRATQHNCQVKTQILNRIRDSRECRGIPGYENKKALGMPLGTSCGNLTA